MVAYLFYGLTSLAMSVRCASYLMLGKTLHDGDKNTSPRPSWPIPPRLLFVVGRRKWFLHVLLVMLTTFAAAFCADRTLVRLLAALSHTIFSMGCAYALQWGHGQYPVLYISWALYFSRLFDLGAQFEVAFARAAVCYLYLAAGLAKVWVPRASQDYFHPATMRELMSKQTNGNTRVCRFNALFPFLSAIFFNNPLLLSAITWGTMILELCLVPSMVVFCIPGFARMVAMICCAFHLGIWATFSSTAGTMFFQLSGAYCLMAQPGPSGTDIVTPGTWPWFLGVVLGLSPAICVAIRQHPFVSAEYWPGTNCALFPWSDLQIQWVTKHLGGDGGNTMRMVLTDIKISDKKELVGLPITSRGGVLPKEKLVLHDAYRSLWNWTKVYPEFVHELNAALSENATTPVGMVKGIQRWLQKEQPLLETKGWKPLTYVHVVEIDSKTKLVSRVIL
jgi:hypothetical protein